MVLIGRTTQLTLSICCSVNLTDFKDRLSVSRVKTAIISDVFPGYNAQSLIEQLVCFEKNILYKIKKR